METPQKTFLSVALSVIITTLAVGAIVFASWDEPTATPPSNNVPAPINVGSDTQTKLGSIKAEDFYINKIGKWASELNITPAAPQRGGSFTAAEWFVYSSYGNFWSCVTKNTQTGDCTCPAGFTPSVTLIADTGVNVADWEVYYVNWVCS